MKYNIHFTLPDGTEDQCVVEAETTEDIAKQANIEVARRNASEPWSEEIL